MKITLISGTYKTEFEESNDFNETKDRLFGAYQRVALARDYNKKVTGVNSV